MNFFPFNTKMHHIDSQGRCNFLQDAFWKPEILPEFRRTLRPTQVKNGFTTAPHDMHVHRAMIIGVNDNAQSKNMQHYWHYNVNPN